MMEYLLISITKQVIGGRGEIGGGRGGGGGLLRGRCSRKVGCRLGGGGVRKRRISWVRVRL